MTDRLKQIYSQLWPEPSETEPYIMALQEECARLQQRLLMATGGLPCETGELIKSYIYSREELELYSVIQAFKAGQKTAGKRNITMNKEEE